MSEYERIEELRRQWAQQQEQDADIYTVEPPSTVTVHQRAVSATEVSGVRYYRCGGGRRVIRKKIGG